MKTLGEELIQFEEAAIQRQNRTAQIWAANGLASRIARVPFPPESLMVDALKLDLDSGTLNRLFAFGGGEILLPVRRRLIEILRDLDGHLLAVDQMSNGGIPFWGILIRWSKSFSLAF